jgi:hypothetical protein
MLFDLEEMVKAGGIRKTADLKKKANAAWAKFTCKPHIDWLFKFTESAGPLKVEMSASLKTTMDNIVDEKSSTPNASRLILRLGFEYIASVAWQSALRHPKRGGIWYGSTYCQGGGLPAPINGACHQQVAQGSGCDTNQSRVIWTRDPFGHRGVRGSALAYATYMTLLAQGRPGRQDNVGEHRGAAGARVRIHQARRARHARQQVRAHVHAVSRRGHHPARQGAIRRRPTCSSRRTARIRLKGRVLTLMTEIDNLIVAANP